MTRLRRYHEDNTPYFVTAVVRHRAPIFRDDTAEEMMCDVIDFCRKRYKFLVLSYAIMPDHVHAVLVPAPEDTISDVMRYIKGRFARLYNEGRRGNGAVWQARFYDVAIRSERELVARNDYVEANPVVAGGGHGSKTGLRTDMGTD